VFALLAAALFALAPGAEQPVSGTGERLYIAQCSVCHGVQGEGGRGPALARITLLKEKDDAELRRIIENGIPGTGMPGTRLIGLEIREVVAYVRKLAAAPAPPLAGDSTKGAEIYAGRGGCTRCHSLAGMGGVFAPPLDGIGARRSPQHLRQSLVTPEADFPDEYAWVETTTNAGRRIEGVRVNEDTFSIQVRDVSGRIHSLWKSELRDLRKNLAKSPMPAYGSALTSAELDDLVAYLSALREAR
jgi:putative heme-binding domain-containing protein